MSTESRKNIVLLGWMICILGALFYCYEYLLRIQPSVMVDSLEQYFGVTASGLGVLSAFYYVAYTPMQLFVGGLMDYYGPRRMLTLAVLLCAVGAAIFGFSDEIYLAATGRFLIGFGSAFAFVGVLKLAAIWLPVRHFALFVGLATGLGMVGAMVGNVEMSSLVDHVGWQETLYLSAVLGVVLTPLIWFVVRDHINKPDSEEGHPDFDGVKDLYHGFVEIVKNPQMWIAGTIGCMLFLSLSVLAEMWGVEYLYHLYPTINHQKAAFTNSMLFGGWLFGAPLAGWLSDKIRSRKKPLVIGNILSLIIFLGILYVPMSIKMMQVALFVFGLFSAMQICCFVVGRENCPEHMSGTAVAFINMVVMLGGLLLQPLVGKLMDLSTVWNGTVVAAGHQKYMVQDFHTGMLVIPFGLAISTIAAFFLKESYGQGGEEG